MYSYHHRREEASGRAVIHGVRRKGWKFEAYSFLTASVGNAEKIVTEVGMLPRILAASVKHHEYLMLVLVLVPRNDLDKRG